MLVLGHTGLMKGGLRGLCAGFDEVAKGCNSRTRAFAMTYKLSIQNTELLLLHLALVTPTGTVAGNATILDEGWVCVGEASDPAIAIAERVRRYWKGPHPDLSCAFVQGEWLGKDTSCGKKVAFPVVTPDEHWCLMSDYEEDILDQTERDWAALTGNDGCVHAAYLQFLPVQGQGGLAVGP